MPLKMHFLNVGHGDCTIVEHANGILTMIDINATVTPATTDPILYYLRHFAGRELFRFVATHPHMDHLNGLADLLKYVTPLNFWFTAPNIQKDDFSDSPYSEKDWLAFQALRRGFAGVRPLSPKMLATGQYWTDDHIEIWWPNAQTERLAEQQNKPNWASYVLAIRHAGQLVVLGGDADEAIWEALYNWSGQGMPRVAVLKAPHHGRRSGYYQQAVAAMSPDLIIVSRGTATDTDASHLYRQYGKVLSTKWHGDIVVTVHDDGNISYESNRTRSFTDDFIEALLFAREVAPKAALNRRLPV